MAGGFRISESGDSRLSEADDTRITEELNFASVSLSTSAGFYRIDEASNDRTDEAGNSRVSQDFDAVVFSTVATLNQSAAVSLSGGGGSVTAGVVRDLAHADLTGTGSISPQATGSFVAANSYNASGSISPDADVNRNAATSLSGAGTFANDGYTFIHGGLFTADPEDTYNRITEAGDTRITEASDVRIVADVLPNAAEGIMNVSYTYIAFSSTAYFKWNGQWTQFTPKVKQDGSWDDPLAIYSKIDANNWKRAY
tara:strand:+ start:780 stop:1544 length:765 start_codon:yes stop_codon:yes gene_type:complete